MMKRNIALLLIAALLASFLVLPVSAAEIPEIKLSVVPFTEMQKTGLLLKAQRKRHTKRVMQSLAKLNLSTMMLSDG